jgi:hypothetical protein
VAADEPTSTSNKHFCFERRRELTQVCSFIPVCVPGNAFGPLDD